MRVPTVFAAAGLILVAASATACSGGSKTAATAPAASTGASGAPAAAGRRHGPGFQLSEEFRRVHRPDRRGSIDDYRHQVHEGETSTQNQISNCEYDGPDGALLQISVQFSGGKIGLNAIVATLKAVGHPPNHVSGVGDEAFSEPNPEGNAGRSERVASPVTAPSTAPPSSRSAA